MPEKLTNKSKSLFLCLEENYKNEVSKISKELSETYANATGDGYHDETVQLFEREKQNAQLRLQRISDLLRTAEVQEEPAQFETVELGHSVRVNLLDDPDANEPVEVTILTSANLQVFENEFDMEKKLLVSDKSPLGGALIGSKVDQVVPYNGRFRAEIKSISINKDVF